MPDTDRAAVRQALHDAAERHEHELGDAFNDLLTPAGGIERPQLTRREARSRPAERHGRQRRRGGFNPAWIAVPVVLLLALGGGGFAVVNSMYPERVKEFFGYENDYAGGGSGEVRVVIEQGESGSDIAETLAAQGVTKTYNAFYELLLETTPEPTFNPGTYELKKRMSAAAALEVLTDPANRIVSTVTLPEGETVAQMIERTADATGVPIEDFQAVVKDFRSLGVPKQAPRLEGYLFPATYEFEPGTSAKDMLQTMVDRMFRSLDELGVKEKDRHRVVTLASVVQAETNGKDDAKIARVFLNRLDQDIPLQSDATVTYGAGGGTINPTDEQFADDNEYNTYKYPGLPVGPIESPGDVALEATVNPAKGPWIFFVTVNLETGETRFNTTDAEHEKDRREFQRWLAANPDWAK